MSSIHLKPYIDVIRSRWVDLERDWQSVAIGGMIVVLTSALKLHIPW